MALDHFDSINLKDNINHENIKWHPIIILITFFCVYFFKLYYAINQCFPKFFSLQTIKHGGKKYSADDKIESFSFLSSIEFKLVLFIADQTKYSREPDFGKQCSKLKVP